MRKCDLADSRSGAAPGRVSRHAHEAGAVPRACHTVEVSMHGGRAARAAAAP